MPAILGIYSWILRRRLGWECFLSGFSLSNCFKWKPIIWLSARLSTSDIESLQTARNLEFSMTPAAVFGFLYKSPITGDPLSFIHFSQLP